MLPKPKKIQRIYLDHASTTPMDKRVISAMLPFFNTQFGNPSSLHQEGKKAEVEMNKNRGEISKLMGAMPENIIFTGGGTESDNLAIFGVAKAHAQHGKHIISSPIEHHAVLNSLEELKKWGWDIAYIKPDAKGIIKAEDVINAIRPDTVLVSIMYANNEIGSINPIAGIGRQILQYRKNNKTNYPLFHVDACQAAGYLDLDVEKLHVDLMAISGSKIYGPKGVGALYVRRGVKIQPIIFGGEQERHLRAGTENTAGIAGLAKAMQLVINEREKESKRIGELSRYLWQQIQKQIPNVKLNGPDIGPERLSNNLNITFRGIEGEALLLYLDEYGIMCSTGSACAAKSLEPSHVLKALGMQPQEARGAIRFSLGHDNTKKDIDYLMKYLPAIVEQLRQIAKMK